MKQNYLANKIPTRNLPWHNKHTPRKKNNLIRLHSPSLIMANQIKKLLRWGLEAKPFFIGIGGLLGTGIAAVFFEDGSKAITYFGLFLQLAGLILVAKGIGETRELFNRPTISKRLVSWLKRFPPAAKPQTVHLSGIASGSSMGRGRITVRRNPATPLADRVALIEKELDKIWTEIDTNQQEALKKISETQDCVQKELHEHKTALKKTKHQLEELSVGGLDFEIIGLIWLLFGTVATTIPEEVLILWQKAFTVMRSSTGL